MPVPPLLCGVRAAARSSLNGFAMAVVAELSGAPAAQEKEKLGVDAIPIDSRRDSRWPTIALATLLLSACVRGTGGQSKGSASSAGSSVGSGTLALCLARVALSTAVIMTQTRPVRNLGASLGTASLATAWVLLRQHAFVVICWYQRERASTNENVRACVSLCV